MSELRINEAHSESYDFVKHEKIGERQYYTVDRFVKGNPDWGTEDTWERIAEFKTLKGAEAYVASGEGDLD
jgi:hypothetical protein